VMAQRERSWLHAAVHLMDAGDSRVEEINR
jgi:hypothetical protein